jgi:hypothetical protein
MIKVVNLEVIFYGAQKGRIENTQKKKYKTSHSGELVGGQVSTLETGREEYVQSKKHRRRIRSECQKKAREGGINQDTKRRRKGDVHSLSVERRRRGMSRHQESARV